MAFDHNLAGFLVEALQDRVVGSRQAADEERSARAAGRAVSATDNGKSDLQIVNQTMLQWPVCPVFKLNDSDFRKR